MNNCKRNVLSDVFNDWATDGIFKILTANHAVPWKNIIQGEILDLDYFGNRSGQKQISPLIEKIMDENGLSTAQKNMLAALIFAKYGTAWQKEWDALLTQYSPLENYDMEESEESKDSRSGVQNSKRSRKGKSDAKSHGIGQSDAQDDSNTFAFDSSSETPTGNSKHKDKTSSSSAATSKDEEESQDNARSHETGELERTLTRHGNIGVTTSQQMLESEMQLRIDWTYFEVVFKDVDTVLTVNVFGKSIQEYHYYEKLVNSVNGMSGNVTIPTAPDQYVKTVNGQDGDVIINVPVVPDHIVETVNGQDGDVVLSIPVLPDHIVNTVNGLDGDVTIPTVPANIVNTVNGQTGDVVISAGGATLIKPDSDKVSVINDYQLNSSVSGNSTKYQSGGKLQATTGKKVIKIDLSDYVGKCWILGCVRLSFSTSGDYRMIFGKEIPTDGTTVETIQPFFRSSYAPTAGSLAFPPNYIPNYEDITSDHKFLYLYHSGLTALTDIDFTIIVL